MLYFKCNISQNEQNEIDVIMHASFCDSSNKDKCVIMWNIAMVFSRFLTLLLLFLNGKSFTCLLFCWFGFHQMVLQFNLYDIICIIFYNADINMR